MAHAVPIHELPGDYREVRHFIVTDPSLLFLLNILALATMGVAFIVMVGWGALMKNAGAPLIDVHYSGPGWLGGLLVIGAFLLHEWIHGLAIGLMHHKPRYGMIFGKISRYIRLPIALYATADNAYFRRNEFIVIALAPLVVISLGGMLLIALAPSQLTLYINLAVIFNAGGAIGDLWMTVVALRYPASALVLDQADSVRIYTNN